MGYLKTTMSKKITAIAACLAVGAGTTGYLMTGSDPKQIASDDSSACEVTTAVTAQSTIQTSFTVSNYNAGATAQVNWGSNITPQINVTTTAATTTKAAETTSQTTTSQAATTTTKSTVATKAETTKKAATTTKTAATTPKTVVNKSGYDVNGGTAKQRLNSVKAEDLKQKITVKGNEKAVLEKYMKMIVTDDMTNYEKVLTCYDYLIKHTRYAYGGWNNPMHSVLVKGFGTCTEYSHVMCAMLRYMGFNARTVWGKTAMAAGGYGQHMWVEVVINGNVYVLDPQVDDNMSYGSSISHKRFVKLYSEVKGQYIRGYVENW